MMSGQYILNKDREAVECHDLIEWARSMENGEKRRVGDTKIGKYRVSTVFLGLDHNYFDGGPPLLFETMVFKDGSFDDLEQERCTTWEQAVAQHEGMCIKVKGWRTHADI